MEFINIPLSHIRKQRHREVKHLAQGHTANKQQGWYVKLGNLAPESLQSHYTVLHTAEAHIIYPENPEMIWGSCPIPLQLPVYLNCREANG